MTDKNVTLNSLTTGRHLESAMHTELVVEPELDSFGKRQTHWQCNIGLKKKRIFSKTY